MSKKEAPSTTNSMVKDKSSPVIDPKATQNAQSDPKQNPKVKAGYYLL